MINFFRPGAIVPTLTMAILLLATSCSGGLTKLAVGDVRGYRSERFALNATEGVLSVSMYNAGKKKITFESGRLEIMWQGKKLAVADLRHPVEVHPGWQVAEISLRIRFGRDGLLKAVGMLFPKHPEKPGKEDFPSFRIVGKVGVRSGNSAGIKTISFRRKLGAEDWQAITARFNNILPTFAGSNFLEINRP